MTTTMTNNNHNNRNKSYQDAEWWHRTQFFFFFSATLPRAQSRAQFASEEARSTEPRAKINTHTHFQSAANEKKTRLARATKTNKEKKKLGATE